jgi:hypothetical protein
LDRDRGRGGHDFIPTTKRGAVQGG